MNLNKVFVLGRLTADPHLRTTPSGQSVINIGIATNRTWSDKNNNRQEQAEFHNVVIWGRQAEIVQQFLTKGSLLLVEGRLQTRPWTDKQGQERRTTEIIAERIQLGPRPGGGGGDISPGGSPFKNNQSAVESSSTRAESAENVPTIDIGEGEEIKEGDLDF